MKKTYIRFERGMDDIVGPTLGPYDYVQLTYNELRAGTELSQDLTLAQFEDGEWHIHLDQFNHERAAERVVFRAATPQAEFDKRARVLDRHLVFRRHHLF